MIPPQGNAEFVAGDGKGAWMFTSVPTMPLSRWCAWDETPRQLIRETRAPIPMGLGQSARHDYEYQRCGTCNVFMATEPLAGKRMTKVTERRTKTDWAQFLADIAACYRDATASPW